MRLFPAIEFKTYFAATALAVFAAAFFIGSGEADNGLIRHSLHIDDVKRTYSVYLPHGPDESINKKRPVVFLYHGSRGTGEGLSRFTGFNGYAEREKVIAVYPDALVGNWAEGCGCNNADRLGIKDPEFFLAMIDELKDRYPVDEERIFVAGYSQGGLFVNRLACEFSGRIEGAVVVAANMSVPLSRRCEPGEPVSVTIIQGTRDTVLPYSGSNNGALSLLSAPDAAAFWASANGMDSDPEVAFLPDSSSRVVKKVTYRHPDLESVTVRLLGITGAGHGWPRKSPVDAGEVIVQMAKQMSGK